MINKLSDYGYSFQVKSIVLYLTDNDFTAQILDVLDSDSYQSESLKWIAKQCKDYFEQYKKNIKFEVFKIKVQELDSDLLSTAVKQDLKEVYKNMESDDLDYVRDNILNFFKNQTLKKAILKSVDILETNGDFEEIKNVVDEALKSGTEKNIGHEYFNHFEDRYAENSRITAPTPWNVVDELMQGGLGQGELGVVVAPAGVGKSWVLSKIGSYAILKGLNVVHYTLELNESYVGLRYDSIFTGLANSNLKYHKTEVLREITKLKGELTIKYFPTKSASVNTVGAHLQKMLNFDKTIDLVILDYADIMKDRTMTREVRHALGNIYEDLRGLAGETNVPIWTASQANRSALDEDVIEAGKVAESYAKVMTADFVMSLSRKIEDKVQNTGRFHIIKNRFGPDGLTFPAKINTNTGQIEIYEANTVDGKQQQNKIQNRDRLSREMLANRYDDLMKT
jgi:replicative DNA helicase